MALANNAEPFKVGFLDEGPWGSPENFEQGPGMALRIRFEEAFASGELDRPVELVFAHTQGLPSGTAHAVREGWRSLAEQGALAIIGPGITDNCIAVVDLFEAAHVPTINFPGTTRSRGQYGFHYQLGALYDDGPIIARAIASAGFTEVAVIRDHSPIGQEFFEFFLEECESKALNITCDVKCSPIATEFASIVDHVRSANPQVLVYLGYGQVLLDLSRALAAADWIPPRYTVSAGMHWYSKTSKERAVLSGWIYVDQVDEENVVLRHLVEACRARSGADGFSPMFGTMYDVATLVVLGLRFATVHTPEGVKEGLERIHLVPSALGASGTVMGFGPFERTALKGKDYLLLRQMQGDVTIRHIP